MKKFVFEDEDHFDEDDMIQGSFGFIIRDLINWNERKYYNTCEWHSCRETFIEVMEGDGKKITSRFLFAHSDHEKRFYGNSDCRTNKKTLYAFMREFNKKYKIPVNDRIKFIRTNHKCVLYVQLPDFWRTPLRLSFLTILLRAGLNYKGNVERTVYNAKYFRDTKYAVKKFLEGNVTFCSLFNCEHAFYGWHHDFSGMSKKEIDKCLIPRISKERKK